MTYSPLVCTAIELAAVWHDGQMRKHPTKRIPFIVHPVTVAFLLQRESLDDEVICAGLLHDVVEDCGVSMEELSRQTTPRVAELVSWVTEPPKATHTWQERKAAYRARLAQAPVEALAIACADHVSNISSSLEAAKESTDVWKLFHADKQERLDHERAVLELIRARWSSSLVDEYVTLLGELEQALYVAAS